MDILTHPSSTFHFAAPQSPPPVTMPINAIARYRPPQLPRASAPLSNFKLPPVAIPHFNSANPNRVRINIK